ncbi:MAG: amidase family protein, partial [Mycobacterium sp.]
MVYPPAASGSRFPTVTDQLYQLASGEVTSVELVRRALRGINASQSTLNAFRVVFTESALVGAAEADRRRAAGHRAPLLGIPIAIKDDTDIAGIPTSF